MLQRLLPPLSPKRRLCAVPTAAAGKGFGGDTAASKKQQQSKQQKQQQQRSVDGTLPQDKAVQQALRAAGAVRPIDPKEAARGRLDVATVKDWGSGDPGKLGDLSVTRMTTQFDASAPDRPLSIQLARLLEQLEVRVLLVLKAFVIDAGWVTFCWASSPHQHNKNNENNPPNAVSRCAQAGGWWAPTPPLQQVELHTHQVLSVPG